MHLSFVFSPDKAKKSRREEEEKKKKGKSKGDSRDTEPRPDLRLGGAMDKEKSRNGRLTPRLERRNAKKNIDYEAASAGDGSSSDYESPSGLGALRSRSLDLPLPSSYASKTSFRIDGESEGKVDMIWLSLGLAGPEDFAIPAAAWEARKGRSSSDLLPKSRLLHLDDEGSPPRDNTATVGSSEPPPPPRPLKSEHDAGSAGGTEPQRPQSFQFDRKSGTRWLPPPSSQSPQVSGGNGGGRGAEVGIKGPRPPALAQPPPISVPKLTRQITTPWDFVKSLARGNDSDPILGAKRMESSSDSEAEDESKVGEDGAKAEEERRNEYIRSGIGSSGEEASCSGPSSFATSTEDDSPSTDASPPVRSFKRQIEGWIKGEELGRGSFGTVYKAIKDDGGFFAVKEVSLLDQGCNAEQCIQQLEQEIALLSNFEHENIVQYLGTKKEAEKLYIYLELVTQGSLASLYRKYHLRDTQVSAYTRQILNGLKYLHERNVVHRDIKCANILVHANGSVKLADFGLAKEMNNISMLKSCKGSVYWMAPEVVKPQKSYGPAADIWSLGCTVLEMLTQKLPYPELEWTQALFKIGRGGQPDIPDSLSKDAQDFIAQCVQVDPDKRPPAVKLLDHPFVKKQSSISMESNSSSHGRQT